MYSNNLTVALKIAMPLIVLTTNTIAMKCWIIVSSKNESFFCHRFRSTFYILYTLIFRGFRVEVTMYTWLLKSIPANPMINRVQNGNVCMVVNYVNIQYYLCYKLVTHSQMDINVWFLNHYKYYKYSFSLFTLQ